MNISARISSRVYKECGSQRHTSHHPRGDWEDVAAMHPGSRSHRQILSSQHWSPRKEEEARFVHGCRLQPSSGGPYHTIFRTVTSTVIFGCSFRKLLTLQRRFQMKVAGSSDPALTGSFLLLFSSDQDLSRHRYGYMPFYDLIRRMPENPKSSSSRRKRD